MTLLRTAWRQTALRPIRRMAFVLLLAGGVWPASAANGLAQQETITIDGDTPWIVSAQEPEALQRALRDVENDWYKVFGRLPTVLPQPPQGWDGPLIYLGLTGPWIRDLAEIEYPGRESFVLRALPDAAGRGALLATGADPRGAIYAAYAFSEEILGVDPWYYWVDKQPRRREKIEVPSAFDKTWGPPTFKYRGWFINDEDLLAGYAGDPMRENVISLFHTDKIYETLLRLRGNTIIPGTFTFPDEQHQVLAAKRGLINSQHHINVVGLNTFQWPDDLPYSYHTHPEILEQAWQTCIDAMKDREVIWTVGYRGKHDRPFWADDRSLDTPEARGKLISDAIAKQVEMVRRAQPRADCICNLWMEGVELYEQGYVRLPQGVILVWPDDGSGLIRDNQKVQAGQGVYYHTAMLSGRHNQLTEMVDPARIHQELTRFVRAAATQYFVVNVSDVRPVPLGTDYAMRLAWDADAELDKTSSQAMEDFLLDWSGRQFAPQVAQPVAAIYRDYFATPHIQRRTGDNYLFSQMGKLMASVAREANRDEVPTDAALRLARECLEECREALGHLVDLAERAESLRGRIPESRADFYQSHVLTQIAVHRRGSVVLQSLSEAVLALGAEEKTTAVEHLDVALKEYDALLAALRAAEYGRWKGWYAGEQFVGIDRVHNGLKRFRACLAGQRRPIGRTYGRYAELYRYQEKFRENFPLLYPRKTAH